METPKVNTTQRGLVAITALPDKALVEGYLYHCTNAGDLDLVRLLDYAEPDAEKAGAILRLCLDGKKRLVAVYPGEDETPPKGGKLIGVIPDGVLYYV